MRTYTDRFETVLPKERFFTPKQAPPKQKPPLWGFVVLSGILLATMLVVTHPRSSPLAGVPPTPVATPPPLPDPVRVARALPMPVTTTTAPRAQLLHIRPIDAFENDTMPDGRIIGTTYRGELQSVTQLPRMGAQAGDMWYTRQDGHCWVLAPIYAGTQTMGWVDP